MDWYSRYVLSWEVSNSLDSTFCCTALEHALRGGTPVIFNTDQGSQFTSQAFTSRLEAAGVQISMDGRGRVFDNIFIEWLWRSVKYEHLYLYDYPSVPAVVGGLNGYFTFYNTERPHQSLNYQPPASVHFGGQPVEIAAVVRHAQDSSPVKTGMPMVDAPESSWS